MNKENDSIGQRLYKARKATGLTQKDMAAKAGLSRTFIGNVENGSQNPSFDFLVKLAKTYGLSIDWLLFGKGQMKILPGDHYLNHLDPGQLELLDKLQSLSPEKRAHLIKAFIEILDALS